MPKTADYLLLILLSVIYSGSFMLTKIAIVDVPPVTMTAIRMLIASFVFALFVMAAGRKLPRGQRTWLLIAGSAITGFAAPFTLISWGLQVTGAGLGAILMAGTPLFTLVLSHFVVADDRLSWPKIAGVVFGVVGVVILIGPSALAGLGGHVVREVAILMAGFCFAANSVIAKLLSGEEPYALSASIFMVGAALSVPFALIMEAPFQIAPSTASTIAVLLLGLLPTGLATLFMLALLRRTGPSFFSQINFLVPIFGVAWAMAVLGERPGANAWIALVLVLAGVAIARRAPGPRPAVKLPSETISP